MEKRHVVVDSAMRTNLPRVFAAGDITEYPGKVRLIAVGFGEAATAVNNAAVAIDPSAHVFPGHSSEGLVSARDRVRMGEDEVAAFLAGHLKVQVASIGRDGAPHLTTLFYVLLDGRIAFWTYATSQKVRNLERDPRISCAGRGRHGVRRAARRLASPDAPSWSATPTGSARSGRRWRGRMVGAT